MPLNVINRDSVFFLLAALLVIFYVVVAGGGFPLDDSWIHQTFGRNLAQHGEWSFIPGQPSAASTSPLYTVLLSIGYSLGIHYLPWTHALGIAALTITAMLGARLAEVVVRDEKHNRFVGWLTGLALLCTWHLIWAAASGMETLLMAMMTLLLIWLAWRELADNRSYHGQALLIRGAIFGAATALAALTRPEGVVLGGIAALLMLIVQPQGNLRKVMIWGSAAAVGFAVFIMPYLLLNLQLTGGLLPDTAAAKFEQHAILLALPYTTRIYNLIVPILSGGQFLLLPGVVIYIVMLLRRSAKRYSLYLLLPLLWFAALIMLYAARLPAAYQHGRYVIPALPAFIIMGVIGTGWLVQWGRFVMLRRVLTRTLAASIVMTTLYFVGLGAGVLKRDVAVINSEMVTAAHWIADNLPADELLVVHDIGAVGYFAPREMLDIAGLVSPEAIPIVADAGALWALMYENNGRYLMAFPNQIPGHNPNDPRLCPIFTTNAPITQQLGEANMTIYRLDWDASCGG